MIQILVDNLALFLLFMPPLFVFILKDSLKPIESMLSPLISFPIGVLLTYILSSLIPEATYVFIFYLLLFHFVMFFTGWGSKNIWQNKFILSKIESFSLSVYFCFAISVLWEWPFQLAFQIPYGIYQEALMASSFKALGILFFFYTVYRIGWRPYVGWLMLLMTTLMIGLLLTFLGIYFPSSSNELFWHYQTYRLPWILLLLLAIPRKPYKDTSIH